MTVLSRSKAGRWEEWAIERGKDRGRGGGSDAGEAVRFDFDLRMGDLVMILRAKLGTPFCDGSAQ